MSITPVFTIEDKQALVQRLDTMLSDHRLDWQNAISVAVDAMEKFKPSYMLMPPKEVLRLLEPERFMFVKMQGLAVKAMTILMQEYV